MNRITLALAAALATSSAHAGDRYGSPVSAPGIAHRAMAETMIFNAMRPR